MIPAGERPAWIEATLRDAFEPEYVEVQDESDLHRGHPGAAGGGGHFRVTLVSRRFAGQARVARHRMVYGVLGDALRSDVHALAVHVFTPEEWEAEGSGR